MPHVRERDPNPDELPEDTAKQASPVGRDTSSGPDQTADADVDADAAVLDPDQRAQG